MNGISYQGAAIRILLARAAGYGFALVGSIVVARHLGVERLGHYAYAMGLAALFGLLPNLGIGTVVTRAVAASPNSSGGIVETAVRAQWLLAGGVAAGISLFAAVLPGQPVPLAYVGLAAAQLAVGSLSWPYLAVLGGRARYDRLAWVELTTGAAGLVAMIGVAWSGGDVAAFLWAQVVVASLSVLVARVAVASLLPGRAAGRMPLRNLMKEALPFGVTAAVQSAYTRLDIVLLGQLAAPAIVGLYSAAYKPINMAVYLGGTAAGVLFPFVVQEYRRGSQDLLSRTLPLFAVVAPAMALCLSGLAGVLLDLLYGSEFAVAAPILVVLAWSAAANWLYAPLSVALQAQGWERAWLWALSGGLLLNAAGNFWAIPRWGALGAAAVMLVSETAVAGMGMWLAWRSLNMVPPALTTLAVAGAASAGCAALWGLQSAGAVPSTLAALIVYGGLLHLCRVVRIEAVGKMAGRVRDALTGAPGG